MTTRRWPAPASSGSPARAGRAPKRQSRRARADCATNPASSRCGKASRLSHPPIVGPARTGWARSNWLLNDKPLSDGDRREHGARDEKPSRAPEVQARPLPAESRAAARPRSRSAAVPCRSRASCRPPTAARVAERGASPAPPCDGCAATTATSRPAPAGTPAHARPVPSRYPARGRRGDAAAAGCTACVVRLRREHQLPIP